MISEATRSGLAAGGWRALLGTLVAALLLIAPAIASASQFAATAEYPVAIEGEQEGEAVFTLQGTEAVCDAGLYAGTLSEQSETLALEATFSECMAFGFVAATVETEGCHLVLHAGEALGEEQFFGTTEVECSEGDSIVITAATCTVEMGGQTDLESLDLTNQAASFTFEANLGEVEYVVTKDGFLCPLNGSGAAIGQFSASAEMAGIEEGAPVAAFLAEADVTPTPLTITEANGSVVGSLSFNEPGEYQVVEQNVAPPFELTLRAKESCPGVVVVKPGTTKSCLFKITAVNAATNAEAILSSKWEPAGGAAIPRTIWTPVKRP